MNNVRYQIGDMMYTKTYGLDMKRSEYSYMVILDYTKRHGIDGYQVFNMMYNRIDIIERGSPIDVGWKKVA